MFVYMLKTEAVLLPCVFWYCKETTCLLNVCDNKVNKGDLIILILVINVVYDIYYFRRPNSSSYFSFCHDASLLMCVLCISTVNLMMSIISTWNDGLFLLLPRDDLAGA